MGVRHGLGGLIVVVALHVDAPHPQLVPPQLERVVQHLVHRGGRALGLVLAREGQEVLHDARGPPGFGVDHLRRRALVGWKRFSLSSSWANAEIPASGLLSSCATPETSCPIADIFSDWISCSCSIFWSVTSRMTHSTSSSSCGVEYVT